jgi:hypothetical protein
VAAMVRQADLPTSIRRDSYIPGTYIITRVGKSTFLPVPYFVVQILYSKYRYKVVSTPLFSEFVWAYTESKEETVL